MNQTSRDLITSCVAGAVIVVVFASFELVENLYEMTREYEDWGLDEVVACIPALASWRPGSPCGDGARALD